MFCHPPIAGAAKSRKRSRCTKLSGELIPLTCPLGCPRPSESLIVKFVLGNCSSRPISTFANTITRQIVSKILQRIKLDVAVFWQTLAEADAAIRFSELNDIVYPHFDLDTIKQTRAEVVTQLMGLEHEVRACVPNHQETWEKQVLATIRSLSATIATLMPFFEAVTDENDVAIELIPIQLQQNLRHRVPTRPLQQPDESSERPTSKRRPQSLWQRDCLHIINTFPFFALLSCFLGVYFTTEKPFGYSWGDALNLRVRKELNGEELDLAVFTIDMEDYRYEPLSDGHAIRLAVIHPGQFEDILEVSLFTVQFNVDNPPQYEALSYCWGSAQNPQAITTATPGLPDKGNLRVTQNLAVALRHLRFQDQPHTIWIDAICINQSDSIEKGSQVAMMGDIYRLATSVVVWLGPQADNSDRAMQIMNFLGQQVEVNFVYVQMKPSTNTEYQDVADESTNLLLSADDFCSIYHLFSRQWFERLWVRQEIFLANPSAYVLCGLSYVPWLTFRKSWYCIHSKPHPGFQFSYELEDRMELLRAFLFQKTRINLFDLRVNLGTAKCQDPRDRIYAVLRMLNEPYGALNIVPDYNKTAIEIYTEVTVAYLKRFQDASILNECQPSPGASGPSWVPDWSVEDNTLNYWGVCYASGPIATWWSLPEPGVLRMAGVSAGVIEKLHIHSVTRHFTNQSTLPEVRRLLGEDGVVEGDSRDNAQAVETYARTLCLDMFEDFIPMSSLPTFAGSVGSLRRIIYGVLSESDVSFDIQPSRFLDRCRSYLPGRQIFITKDGDIGLASASARVGDEICVLLGLDSPILLRPEKGGRYFVVGVCYLSSAQFGESILSDLPQGVRLTNRWNERSNQWERGFKDSSSGQFFYEDSRLQKVVEDYPEYCRHLQEVPTGRWSVNPEVLRGAGVDVRDFDLV